MCLPWREGPFARHWHMTGNSNWKRVVCVKPATRSSFQRKSGVCGRKNTMLTPDATFGNLWALLPSHQPADLISAFLASLTRGSNQLWGRFLQPGDAHCGTQASGRLKGKETPWRDSTGSDGLASLSDQTRHTCLGHWCRCSRSALTVVINRWQLTV